MKGLRYNILLLVLASLFLLTTLAACGDTDESGVSSEPPITPGLTVGGELPDLELEFGPAAVPAEKIEPSSPDVNIPVGATSPLAVVYTPEEPKDKELLWETSDKAVATVSPTGAVTGVKEGQCTVTATLKSNPALQAVFNVSVGISLENATSQTDYLIAVYLGSQSVCVYTKGANGAFTLLQKTMTCSTGVAGKETLTGEYTIVAKYRWRQLVGGTYGQYGCSLGKNNYLFHSVPYALQAPNALKMNEYRKLGQKASQGCVRLSVADAKWIYDTVPLNTSVLITEATGPKGPAVTPLNSDAVYSGWDPTDPSMENPYINPSMRTPLTVTLNVTSLRLTVGQTEHLTATISGAGDRYQSWYSTDEQVASVTQSGQIKAKKPGITTITVQVGDAKASCTVRVVDSTSSKSTSSRNSSSKSASSRKSSSGSKTSGGNPSSAPNSSSRNPSSSNGSSSSGSNTSSEDTTHNAPN